MNPPNLLVTSGNNSSLPINNTVNLVNKYRNNIDYYFSHPIIPIQAIYYLNILSTF